MEAGIQEFMSPDNVQIKCTIKHRISDFIVNEIDENGRVVWFTPENDLQKWKKQNADETTNEVDPNAEESKEEMKQRENDRE